VLPTLPSPSEKPPVLGPGVFFVARGYIPRATAIFIIAVIATVRLLTVVPQDH
jgi:hypothetical protein